MRLSMLIQNEFKKIRRTGIFWILLIPILFAWIPAVVNADSNFQMQAEGILPEYNFLVQSFMAYAWFLFPASLIISTVMLIQLERSNQGILKMLAMPIQVHKLAFAKFIVLLCISIVQILMMTVMYYIAAVIAGRLQDYQFVLPVTIVIREAGLVCLSAVPMAAVFWLAAVIIPTPIFSIGIGMVSIVPSVLFINTKVWFLYPMCYPFMLMSKELQKYAANLKETPINIVHWVSAAIGITVICLTIACSMFGKEEIIR